MKTKFPVIADMLAVIAFVLSLFLVCNGYPNTQETSFDYQAIIVGILGGLFTLIVGWNIYQMVDWKKKIELVEELSEKIKEEINYIHNKQDYNQAVAYGIMSQSASVSFAPNERETIKKTMILKGLTAIKQLSYFPDTQKEISSILSTLCKGMNNSSEIKLDRKFVTDMIMLCGEIKNRDHISGFEEFVDSMEAQV